MVRRATGFAGVCLGVLAAAWMLRADLPVWGVGFLLLFAAAGLALARQQWHRVRFVGALTLILALLGVMTIGATVLPGAALVTAASHDGLWRTNSRAR